jgi:hypothetical protein
MTMVFSWSHAAVLGVEWGLGFPKLWKAGTKLADVGIRVLHGQYLKEPAAKLAGEAVEELTKEIVEHKVLGGLGDWLEEQTKKAARRAARDYCRGKHLFFPPPWPPGLE